MCSCWFISYFSCMEVIMNMFRMLLVIVMGLFVAGQADLSAMDRDARHKAFVARRDAALAAEAKRVVPAAKAAPKKAADTDYVPSDDEGSEDEVDEKEVRAEAAELENEALVYEDEDTQEAEEDVTSKASRCPKFSCGKAKKAKGKCKKGGMCARVMQAIDPRGFSLNGKIASAVAALTFVAANVSHFGAPLAGKVAVAAVAGGTSFGAGKAVKACRKNKTIMKKVAGRRFCCKGKKKN